MKQWSRIAGTMAVVVASVAISVTCADQRLVSPDSRGAVSHARPSASGAVIPEMQMQQSHGRVVRDVAMALADARLRSIVYTAIQQSKFREHKLHFRNFLQTDGRDLFAAIVEARHTTTPAVLAALDSIVDLEFYMPWPAHRAAWTGGAKLLVAGALGDDGEPLVGYDLSGNSVDLSPTEPPTTPTLVLVPVETDFSAPQSPQRGPQAPQTAPKGVWVSQVMALDDHEPWYMFEPEFEFHSFVEQPGEWTDVSCAGAERGGTYYYWDYNDTPNYWTGEVLIATEDVLAVGDSAVIQLWEDDTGACTATGGRPPDTDEITIQDVKTLGGFIFGLLLAGPDSSTIKKLSQIFAGFWVALELGSWIHDDDFVGLVSGPTAGCYPATGPTGFQLIHKTDGVVGSVLLDERFADASREPLCPPPELSVQLSGLTVGQPYQWVTITATVSNYVAPVTYEWTVNQAPACGNESTCGAYLGDQGTYTVFGVTVTDALPDTAGDSWSVFAECTTPPCDNAPSQSAVRAQRLPSGAPAAGSKSGPPVRRSPRR